VWTLAQIGGVGHRSLVTPEREFSEDKEDLIFGFELLVKHIISRKHGTESDPLSTLKNCAQNNQLPQQFMSTK